MLPAETRSARHLQARPAVPAAASTRSPALPYLALAALALIWGASFFLIKVAVADMSPEALVLARTVGGTAVMAAILLATRRNPFRPALRRRFPALLFMAVFYSVLPWISISWGELYVASGLTSILNATTPLWTALLALWVTPEEKPGPLNLAGVALGFAGTVLLVVPDLLRHGLHASVLGALAVLLGAASYAVASLFQRRRLAGVSPLEASSWQLALAALVTVPLAAPTLAAAHLHVASASAALALGLLGTGVGTLLYYYLLNSVGATRATTVNFLLPVTAVVWGAVLLHEPVTVPILVGMVVILAGVALVSRRRAR
jgi:drug/metabolite transporter (DMT)-like permease